MTVLLPQELIDNRVTALRKAHKDAGIEKAELDISGGVDSAVMACLLVEALGPESVILVHSSIDTNPAQTARAKALADAIHCPMLHVDLGDIYERFISIAGAAIVEAYDTGTLYEVQDRCRRDKTVLGSIRSTLRAPVGRAFNRLLGGGIRHGTGNECEDRFLRFYQKGGDGEVDSNPLAILSKTEVYQLAFALGKRLGVEAEMRSIIEATPSPDLWGVGDNHSDEAELLSWTGAPFTYGRIDPETGRVVRFGTIERVSRFLDTIAEITQDYCTMEYVLFFSDPDWDCVLGKARDSGLFTGLADDTILNLLQAARKAERSTRHKVNPNCPTYGDRATLVRSGILTDALEDSVA